MMPQRKTSVESRTREGKHKWREFLLVTGSEVNFFKEYDQNEFYCTIRTV